MKNFVKLTTFIDGSISRVQFYRWRNNFTKLKIKIKKERIFEKQS